MWPKILGIFFIKSYNPSPSLPRKKTLEHFSIKSHIFVVLCLSNTWMCKYVSEKFWIVKHVHSMKWFMIKNLEFINKNQNHISSNALKTHNINKWKQYYRVNWMKPSHRKFERARRLFYYYTHKLWSRTQKCSENRFIALMAWSTHIPCVNHDLLICTAFT